MREKESFYNMWVWGESGEKGCVYVKECLKQIFTDFFLAWPLRKLKFQITMVGFAPLPPSTQYYLPSYAYANKNFVAWH